MTMVNFKSKLSLIICIVLIAAIALFTTACGDKNINTPDDEITTEAEVNSVEAVSAETVSEIGQGETSFYFSVFYEDGTSDNFVVNTDKTTVGEALMELELIGGEEGPYGLYVKTVNGVTADYSVNGTYWAFYADGAYASAGADMTEITEGSLYAFRVEK